MSLRNAEIAELLARRAEEIDDRQRSRAYRRAARAALIWPEEAAELCSEGRSPAELERVGPRLAGLIRAWLEDPPEVADPAEQRAGFLTQTEVTAIVAGHPEWRRALKGDLQMHTTGSDGKEPVDAMARTGAGYGYEYIAVTDHTKTLKIAGGMDEDAFRLQAREIAAVNERLATEGVGLHVLRSAEVNVNPRGETDMDASFLAGLDLVLGSFHSSLRGGEDQTGRYIGAIRNPAINTLGHPRGRIYNRRIGLRADWERVFQAAAETGTAVEIDCYPDRQDLDVDLLRIAATVPELRFQIGTDAHNTQEMRFIDFGLALALSAGIEQERIVNFWPEQRLLEWSAEVRAA